MEKRPRYRIFLGLLLLVFLPPTYAEEIAPGLRYQHRVEPGPLSIHWLEVDPDRISIRLKHAGKGGLGRGTVSTMAREQNALAAINGGFFTIGGRFDGKATGLLKVEDGWLSDSPLPRGVIGWEEKGRDVLIGRLRVFWTLTFGKSRFPVDRINADRGNSGRVVYTAGFHSTTMTDASGIEVVVAADKITEIVNGGNSAIPEVGFVYSVGSARESKLSTLKPGMPARLEARFQPGFQARPSPSASWSKMDFILGGTPVLVSGNRQVSDFSKERIQLSFVNNRHPRTAVGIRKDGVWILLVVDGRQPQKSLGMTLHELAKYLLSLGCVRALNLDGGGSSTIFVNGSTRNSPSDPTGERPVSDAILLFPNNPKR